MFLTFLLTVSGCLILGRAASRSEKNPFEIPGAFLLVALAATLNVGAGLGVLATAGQIALELGIGLVLTAGLIARRKGPARPFFGLGIMALTVAVLILAGLRIFAGSGEAVSLLVELGPDDSIDEIESVLARHHARVERAFPLVDLSEDADLAQVYIVSVPADRVESLTEALRLDRENVDHLEENRLLGIPTPVASGSAGAPAGVVLENDPLAERQWALEAIGAHEAHRLIMERTPAARARVAILDTGVDGRHEDISGALGGGPALVDGHGHGSHCAGIAGGMTNNGLGIASLNWEGRFVEVTSYGALDANGFGTIERIAQAVLDAARDDADVISMSLGDRAAVPPKVLSDAIAFARRRGAVVVAAAGNANSDAAMHTPSNVEGVIAVAALSPSLQKAPFSNTNTRLSRPLAAPGVDILSLQPGGGYVSMSGTSMATPMVAGLIGVMRSLDPDLSEDDIYRILVESARDVPDVARTGRMIDAHAALQRVIDGA